MAAEYQYKIIAFPNNRKKLKFEIKKYHSY